MDLRSYMFLIKIRGVEKRIGSNSKKILTLQQNFKNKNYR